MNEGDFCPDSQGKKRPGVDQYFMEIAHLASQRSTCTRRKVGAVIVKDKRILATGYNGPPKGIEHCTDRECIRTEMGIPSGEHHELCRGIHAEQNAIIQAAIFGINVNGAAIYATNYPCSFCAKMIINAGIGEIVYDKDYKSELSTALLQESGLTVRKIASDWHCAKG
jgi:dCMP deaminase